MFEAIIKIENPNHKEMTEKEIKSLIQQELPHLIAEDPAIRDFILRTVSNYYAEKTETESRFDRILAELQRDREEQTRKWEEQDRKWEEQRQERIAILARLDREYEENQQRWDENQQRWDEQHQHNKELLEEIKKLDQKHERKYNSTIGALGSRWGLFSEASFRNGLMGILGESFGVTVMNLTEFDEAGEVFGRPDQVEIDVIIKNGLVIVCEIKSSIDKAGMYIFDRKAAFYAKHHNCTVNRKIVICPMVDSRAIPVAQALGIEVYSYSDQVENL